MTDVKATKVGAFLGTKVPSNPDFKPFQQDREMSLFKKIEPRVNAKTVLYCAKLLIYLHVDKLFFS